MQEKLGKVVQLCKENRVIEALDRLYKDVFYPHEPPQKNDEIDDKEVATDRLIVGLQRVLTTNSTDIVQNTTVDHLHLIGEYSNLVNVGNVIAPKTGLLLVVPKAGMRVLQDNPSYCKNQILAFLGVE